MYFVVSYLMHGKWINPHLCTGRKELATVLAEAAMFPGMTHLVLDEVNEENAIDWGLEHLFEGNDND